MGISFRTGADLVIVRHKSAYQLFTDENPSSLEIRALNIGVDYFVAVEAFNESGVSKRSRPIAIR